MPFQWKISGRKNGTSIKVSPVFPPNGMFQTAIRVNLVKTHLGYHFKAFTPFYNFLLKELICANGKHDCGRKINSPEFFLPLAQTKRLLEHNNEHNNTVTHHFFA